MTKKSSYYTRGIVLLTAVCLVVSLAACSRQSGASGKDKKLYIFNWTYYTPESVLEKFSKEYGIEVIVDYYDSNETMYNKIVAGGSDFDIVFPSCDYTEIMIKKGMLRELDASLLKNLGNIDPTVLEIANYDREMRYSVPYYWGASGIAVNKAKVPYFERSWSLFARKDLKDRVTMFDDMREVLGDALVSLGYSVNTRDGAELAAARDLVVNQWKPNIRRFDADSFAKNYANGSFWAVQCYAEGIYTEIAGNDKLLRDTEFFIPQEGGAAYIDSMCLLKEAQNVENAHLFIDFIHRPEIYAEFCDSFLFPAGVNVPARELLKNKPAYQIEDLLRCELKRDLGETLDAYNKAWDAIRIDG